MLVVLYLAEDPFKVLYHHDKYYFDNTKEIPLDRDFVSTQMFLENYDTYKYDSFIFGNSKSLSFKCDDWSKFIKGNCFHWDASGESLFGILRKLEFLENKKIPVRNCIIVLDSATVAETTGGKGHIYIMHPLVSRDSKLLFQFEFLETFLSHRFFTMYIAEKFGLHVSAFLDYDDIRDIHVFNYHPISNDITFTYAEEEMNKNEDDYYRKYSRYFFDRSAYANTRYEPLIGDVQNRMFTEMEEILRRLKADFRIVIYPVYLQRAFSNEDVAKLKQIFGAEKVLDYSGVNEITANVRNYYESEHGRPVVGQKILEKAYSK